MGGAKTYEIIEIDSHTIIHVKEQEKKFTRFKLFI